MYKYSILRGSIKPGILAHIHLPFSSLPTIHLPCSSHVVGMVWGINPDYELVDIYEYAAPAAAVSKLRAIIPSMSYQ